MHLWHIFCLHRFQFVWSHIAIHRTLQIVSSALIISALIACDHNSDTNSTSGTVGDINAPYSEQGPKIRITDFSVEDKNINIDGYFSGPEGVNHHSIRLLSEDAVVLNHLITEEDGSFNFDGTVKTRDDITFTATDASGDNRHNTSYRRPGVTLTNGLSMTCLLYTSDAADE